MKRFFALVAVAMLMLTLPGCSMFSPPTYTAIVSLYVSNNSNADTAFSSGDSAVALRLVETYVNIIKSDHVLEQVIENTGAPLTCEQLRGMISAESVGETEIFKVSVTAEDPQVAVDLANAIVNVAQEEIPNIIAGSSLKIIDYATRAKVNKPKFSLFP